MASKHTFFDRALGMKYVKWVNSDDDSDGDSVTAANNAYYERVKKQFNLRKSMEEKVVATEEQRKKVLS